MRHFKIVLAGLVWAAFAIPAVPQTAEIQKEVNANLEKQRTQERYEQIEILRRLLDQGLRTHETAWTDKIHSAAFSPDGRQLATANAEGAVRIWDMHTGKQLRDPHAAIDVPTLQGVYLKGQGVVYTTTIPPGVMVPVMDGSATSVEKPLTEWERVRSEVRGEKPEPKKPKSNPSLADLLLKTLAENGKHMTQLPDAESITVAVTLAPMQSCTACHANPWSATDLPIMGSMFRGTTSIGNTGSTSLGTTGTTSSLGGSKTSSTGTSGSGSSTTTAQEKFLRDLSDQHSEAKKTVLVGDLHLKQKQYHEATVAFQKASESFANILEKIRKASLDLTGTLPPPNAVVELDLLESRTKLAQALVGEGKQDEARKILSAIATQAQRGAQGEPAKPAEKPGIALPSKLIVTVSKKSLEAVGSGKMSFEEFRKAATVEYLNFSEKGPEKAKE
jgi:hypothetical protein